jgi:multidrug efflux pump subunit AcrA (membrane-fusion protein)
VDAFPDKEFTGKVMAIYPKALIQQNVVTYDVVIAIDNREGLLRPDMTANTTITVAKRDKVLAIPNQAVRREDGQRVAFVEEGDRFIRRPIKTGWKDKTYTEVLGGLREGDRVVVGELENGKTAVKGTLPPGAK